MRVKEEDIQIILEAYKTYHGNATEAGRHLPWCHATILTYWHEHGLKVNRCGDLGDGRFGRGLSEEEIKQVVMAYTTYHGNATEAERHLPWSNSTIRKYWKGNDLEANKGAYRGDGRFGRGLSKKEIKQIVAAYKTYYGNATEAERHLPWSHSTIGKYWKMNGIEPKGKRGKRSLESKL